MGEQTHQTRAPSSQPTGNDPSSPPGLQGIRASLRGASYADGAATLSPASDAVVQKKEDGTVTSTTDPRLTYTKKAEQEGVGLDAQVLPYNDPKKPGAGWDSREILSKLTQVDEDRTTTSDRVRCGANAGLAIAIMAGPEGVRQFGYRLDRAAFGVMTKKNGDAQRKAAVTEAYMRSGVAAFRVSLGTGTYGDLSSMAHSTKVIMSATPDSATTGHEASSIAKLAGDTTKYGSPLLDSDHLKSYAKSLKPGEAYILHVDTDVKEGGSLSQRDVNHFVTLGKEPKEPGRKSRTFLYDPYPREGTQYMYSNDPNFWTLFFTAKNQWKAVYLVSKTTAGKHATGP